jgi:hypothetical protein
MEELRMLLSWLHIQAGRPRLRRARLIPVLYFRRPARRDPSNYGAGLKQHVDALVRAGWLPDDSGRYLVTVEPVLRRGPDVTVLVLLEEIPEGA